MTSKLLRTAANHAVYYLESLSDRPVAPGPEALGGLNRFDEPLPEGPTDPEAALHLLNEAGSPATMATAGGRFFGFVVGGSLPAALAANWLAGAWDQNVVMNALSPVGAAVGRVAAGWLRDLLGLPDGCQVSFVTGTTMANFTGLLAGRHAVLKRAGWDVETDGLFDAPPVTVLVGSEAHPTVYRGLGMLGLGRGRVVTVPADGQGRMRADALPRIEGPTIICIQAGNVNTGAFDPAAEIVAAAREAGAWVHVDGAFGLWAAAAPGRAHLMEGFSGADSWATDGHKWLNVPYDSGLAIVRDRDALGSALSFKAPYLVQDDDGDPMDFTPESSQRVRAIEIWAALRSLGREGVADLIERCCRHATRFAEGFRAAGFEVLNDVVLNQVLVSFGDAEATRRVIEETQAEGTCWCGGTVWQGRTAMRISVSSWATTDDDVARSLDAILGTCTKLGFRGRSTGTTSLDQAAEHQRVQLQQPLV